MENMVVRAILAMFICASMAACGTSKDSGAPVHVGKGQTAQKNGQQTEKSKEIAGSDDKATNPGTPSDSDLQDEANQMDPATRAQVSDRGQKVGQQQAPVDQSAGQADQGAKQEVKKGGKPVAEKPPVAVTPPVAQNPAQQDEQCPDQGSQKPAKPSKPKPAKPIADQPAKPTKPKKINPIDTADLSDATLNRMKAEADRYSGTASDYLRNLLIMKADSVSREEQSRDLQVAAKVKSASLDMDARNPGRAIITLTVADGRNSRELQLSGNLTNGRGRMAPTKSINAVKGEIICMDQNQLTCETAIADLIVNDHKNSARLRIIFRNTAMHLNAKFPNKNCSTQGCQDIYTLFSRTDDYDTGYGVRDAMVMKRDSRMETFEVINGRTGFRLVMHTVAGQVIAFGGPLFNQKLMQSSSTNLVADRNLTTRDQLDYDGANYRTNLNNELTDIRIVDNDGIGNVLVSITTEGREGSLQDSMQLEIRRQSKDLRGMVGMELAAGK